MSFLSSAVGLNPYTLIAGAVAVASITGTIVYQNHEIHSWHMQYLTDEKMIAILRDDKAKAAAEAKQRQTETTPLITSVVMIPTQPKIVTVTKTIHDAPIPQDCSTPAIDVLRNNT